MSADPPDWPFARILAHRGAGRLAPENTVAAIAVGRENACTAIECDAMLSSDGVPFLIHDPTLDRTSNGRGAVAGHTAAQLDRLDAGSWFDRRFSGEPLPRLSVAMQRCRALGTWMNIEIKPSRAEADRATGLAVARAVALAYGDLIRPGGDRAQNIAAAVPLLSSFSRDALAAAREACPDLPRGLLCGALPDDWREALRSLAAVSLHCDHRRLDPGQARAVKEAGYWLFCYTVDDPGRVNQLFSWGVDALCTDRPDLVRPGRPA